MSNACNNTGRTWARERSPGEDNPDIRIGNPVPLWEGKWLSLWNTPFTDRLGRSGEWTWVKRVTGKQAVAVLARTKDSKSLVLIRQFRIPLQAWVWEFPAGLVDEGESLESTAVRELKEETGYEGEVQELSLAGVSSPGLATEEINLVRMTCPEHPGEHARESSEAIEVHLLAPGDEREFLARAGRHGEAIDAKLLSYLWAIS